MSEKQKSSPLGRCPKCDHLLTEDKPYCPRDGVNVAGQVPTGTTPVSPPPSSSHHSLQQLLPSTFSRIARLSPVLLGLGLFIVLSTYLAVPLCIGFKAEQEARASQLEDLQDSSQRMSLAAGTGMEGADKIADGIRGPDAKPFRVEYDQTIKNLKRAHALAALATLPFLGVDLHCLGLLLMLSGVSLIIWRKHLLHTIQCPYCKTRIPEDAKVCQRCGRDI